MTTIATPPALRYRDAFLEMLNDFESNDPQNAEVYLPAKLDFAAYVRELIDEENGRNLRDGWVPCTHRWLIVEKHVVGVSRLRHRIDTPLLAGSGGHIGYDVAPSWRRRGYGHFALDVALMEAARFRLSRVLMFASEGNVASRTVIERRGGELESISASPISDERLCKYWITVPSRF